MAASKRTIQAGPRKRTQAKSAAEKTSSATEATKSTDQKVTEGKVADLTTQLRNLEWIMERTKANELPIYTMDIETDPFKRDRVPEPYLIGFYDGLKFWRFWTDDEGTCVEKMRVFLDDEVVEPGIIYMHNGGRFDFFYLLDFFEGKSTIINSRIISAFKPSVQAPKAKRLEKGYRWEFRDSFAIMPFALKQYRKDDLPIEYHEKKNRQKHASEIESYLFGDCSYLWELCMGFQREFGDFKTIASAAFTQLSKFHRFETLTKRTDVELRRMYYFGGRVQCFELGVIKQPVAIYDVNSMYPYVMANYLHPTSWPITVDTNVLGWNSDGTPNKEKLKTFFLTVQGENDGAFPTRTPDGIDFEKHSGIFHVTIHEFLTALQHKRFKLERVIDSYSFLEYSCFHQFVDHFYSARQKVIGDFNEHKKTCEGCAAKPPSLCVIGADLIAHSMYYKFVLNSAYGKFGLNPDNYFNWEITKTNEHPNGEGWQLDMIAQDNYYVWKQPSQLGWNVKNIATAASITGAARSILLRAIATSNRVIYCDTDSIICKEIGDVPIDDKKLGAWKKEGTGVLAAIARKKLYAIFDENGRCFKMASKGLDFAPDVQDQKEKMQVAGEQILRVSKGEEIMTWRIAPTFKRDGSADFIHRTARREQQ